MESLSRPFHRRKLSNANSFSAKNAYDGVFSGHRPKYDGTPVVNVEEYSEIFGSPHAASSIPVLDLSTLQESSDGTSLELGSTKPDYGKIFGGFRDQDIAVSYEELFARDKARAPSSISQSSDNSGDLSHQSFDALKQFNMSYNRINQRSKDGLDGTTHVTQLHAVPGFTCFIDEGVAQPKKETKKQKSSVTNNVPPSVNFVKGDFPEKQTSRDVVGSRSKSLSDDSNFKTFHADLKSHPSNVSSSPAASQPKEETEKQKSSVMNNVHPGVNSGKGDFHEKGTSGSAVESKSKYHQDESLSDDRSSKTSQADIKINPSKVSSSPAAAATKAEATYQPKEETEKQKSSVTNNDHPSVNSSKGSFPEKQTSGSAVGSRSIYHQVESLSDHRSSKTFQADIKLHPSKESSSPVASATSADNHKDYQKRSTATNTGTSKSDSPGVFFPTSFYEEVDVNSAAAASAAALRKAIEKAQESIRIAKESVGRKKEGLRSFTSKSFKDSLKVKAKANVSAGKHQKEEDNEMEETLHKIGAASQVFSNIGRNLKYGGTAVFPDFADGEKLSGAKKVIDEIQGKISESAKNSDIPIGSSHGLVDDKTDCNSKEVAGETEAVDLGSAGKYECATGSYEAVENNTHEAPQEDNQRPNGFLVLESCEKNLGDIEDTVKDDKRSESKENAYEVRPSKAHELAEGSNNLTLYKKVEDEKNISQGSDQNVNEKRFSETLGLLENEKQEVLEQEHNEKVASTERLEPNSDDEASEKVLEDESELQEDGDVGSLKEEEDMGDKFYDVCELEMIENAQTHAYNLEKNEASPKEDCEMKVKESHKGEETWKKLDEVHEPEIYDNSSSDYDDAEESESNGCHGASHIVVDAQEDCEVYQSDDNVESSQEVDDVSSSSAEVVGTLHELHVEDAEAIDAQHRLEEKETFENISVDHTASKDNEDECETKSDSLSNCRLADLHLGQNETEQNDVCSESSSGMIHGMEIEVKNYKEREELIKKETVVSVEEKESNLQQSHEERPKISIKMETGTSQEPKVSNVVEGTMDMNEYREKKDETRESGASKVVEKERPKRIKEVTAEERERERNRLAVERVIREARERAFAEARERAERAAVERATAEVRQRVMADAQEKVAKATIGTKPSDKTSAQSKLRAERAAVERATAEARQRALEKAMSQKKNSDPRAQANEIARTSSSDLHISNGASAESALRSKAKLEKHNRIMERAAKALAEKEKRDLLAQKEQAERSRLAEILDVDIKRWSSGKEGNLRALLSTLQYILGADSGWQPVSLTEIITSGAVKKAYRKATLCVHPDKLQQRGASIQQKYICEKVFDLLKAAWSKFNSEER